MSKKWIISLSVLGAVVVTMLILFWTLFGLSAVSVEFHSTTNKLTLTEEEIVEAADFRYGSSVLFEGKKKYLKNLEDAAQENQKFAYLRVLNIETVFPNKMVVHVAEREELFAIEHEDKFLICDRDLRVLDILDYFENEQDNAIVVSNLSILDEEVKIGQFLSVEEECLKSFYSAFVANNRDLSQIQSKFAKISISTYQDQLTKKEYVSFELTSHQNKKFVINNPDFAFANKVQKLFAAESALYGQKTDGEGNIVNSNGEVVYVIKTENGELAFFDAVKDMKDDGGNLIYDEADKFALTYEILSGYYIKVDNLTITEHTPRTEKDVFYSLCEI